MNQVLGQLRGWFTFDNPYNLATCWAVIGFLAGAILCAVITWCRRHLLLKTMPDMYYAGKNVWKASSAVCIVQEKGPRLPSLLTDTAWIKVEDNWIISVTYTCELRLKEYEIDLERQLFETVKSWAVCSFRNLDVSVLNDKYELGCSLNNALPELARKFASNLGVDLITANACVYDEYARGRYSFADCYTAPPMRR